MPCKQVVIHAGFHKTGTTSIQSFLGRHRHTLKSQADIFFPLGRFYSNNHAELSGACLRQERETPFKIMTKYDGKAEFSTLQFHAEPLRRASIELDAFVFGRRHLLSSSFR